MADTLLHLPYHTHNSSFGTNGQTQRWTFAPPVPGIPTTTHPFPSTLQPISTTATSTTTIPTSSFVPWDTSHPIFSPATASTMTSNVPSSARRAKRKSLEKEDEAGSVATMERYHVLAHVGEEGEEGARRRVPSYAQQAAKRVRRGQVNRSVVPTPSSLALVVYQPQEQLLLGGLEQQPPAPPTSSLAL